MTRAAAWFVAIALGCGADDTGEKPPPDESTDDGDGDASGDDGEASDDGSADGDGDGEPVCRTLTVANAAAGEKINAAFCFGMAYDEAFICDWYPADNVVECLAGEAGYDVVFTGDASGDILDVESGEHIATVVQGATGEFQITWDSGEYGECTVVGDVATLCVTP